MDGLVQAEGHGALKHRRWFEASIFCTSRKVADMKCDNSNKRHCWMLVAAMILGMQLCSFGLSSASTLPQALDDSNDNRNEPNATGGKVFSPTVKMQRVPIGRKPKVSVAMYSTL